MNFVKALGSRLISLAIGAALVVLSASARRPTATPTHTPAPPSALWVTLHLDELRAAIRARRSMTPISSRRFSPFAALGLGSMTGASSTSALSPLLLPRKHSHHPTTRVLLLRLTPLPPPSRPSSAADTTLRPSSISFAGAEVSACTTNFPNQPPQPPDVAANVSSTQNVAAAQPRKGSESGLRNGAPD